MGCGTYYTITYYTILVYHNRLIGVPNSGTRIIRMW